MLASVLRQYGLRSGALHAAAALSAGVVHGFPQAPPSFLVSLLSCSNAAHAPHCNYATHSTLHRCKWSDWRQSYTYVPHTHTSDQHSRHFAADSQASDETEYPVTRPDHVFVYRGPLAQTVARLKKLSLFSCACAFTASPIIMYMSSATTLGAKASIALTLCGFGAFTTGMMHWFTSPYVHTLTHNSKTGLTEVETLSLFARHQRRTFSELEIQPPQTIKPQATFQVCGQVYYLDADNFEDKELLSKLSPKEPEVASDQK